MILRSLFIILLSAFLATTAEAQILLLGIGSSGGTAPYTFIAAQNCKFTGAGTGCTSTAMNTTGATLFAAIVSCATGSATMSDSSSNTWSTQTAIVGGSQPTIQLTYVLNPVTNASQTFTLSTSPGQFCSTIVEAFGGRATPVFDTQTAGSSNAGSTTTSGGSITPAGSNELILALMGNGGTTGASSVDSGFTIPTNGSVNGVGSANVAAALAYLSQGTGSAVNPSYTLSVSANWVAVNDAFK